MLSDGRTLYMAEPHFPSTPRETAVGLLAATDEEQRRWLRRILDSTPDGVMVIDSQRRVRVFNEACGRLLGQDPARVLELSCFCGDLVGCHLIDGTRLDAESLCPATTIFSGGSSPQTQEMLCRNDEGEQRWVETRYSPVRNDRGEVEYVIGILRDVHDRKVLEARLHQTEKLASLGELTAGIAHEIKNPLGVLLSAVELILDDRRPRAMQLEAAEFIKEEVQRLDSRLRAFLAFARPGPRQCEPVVLNSVARKAVRGLAGARPDLSIELDLETPEVIVHVDPDQMHQVVTNLLHNAAEAIGGGGAILVRTRSGSESVDLEVHDSGPGVPPADRSRIFNPFVTTKADGTGLGLSIVSQILNAHCSTIQVDDSPSLGGARFRVRLPHALQAES